MQPELRNVCFVRHAKSSWADASIPDIHRPLNKRGLNDAPMMAKKLQELNIIPEVIVTSPARRARDTAKYFRDAFNLAKKRFIVEDDLYGADPEEVIDIVQKVDDKFYSVFVFGHNPTMTMLANQFAGVAIDNVPTCGIVQAKTMVGHWKSWSPDVSAFVGFYYPKQYKKA
jgi:phosphohistidine phosphatase